MSDTHHILLDDRPCIQFRSNVVAGSSYNLHTTLECCMVGLRPYKCRKERVMNIDDAVGISVYHFLGNDLHITCQYNEVHLVLGKQFHFFLFLLFFCLLSNRKQMKRYAEAFCYMLQIWMIAYYKRYLHIPFTCRIARQQIEQTVRHLRHENSHTRFDIRKIKAKTHSVLLRIQCFKIVLYLLLRNQKAFQFPLDTHEKNILHMVYILIQIDNITFVYRYKICYFCQNSRLIGTVK